MCLVIQAFGCLDRLGYRLLELGEQKKRGLDFLDILLIDRVFGNRQLRINSYPGLRNSAFTTAVGKVLIGNRPVAEWKSFISTIPAGYPRTADEILADFKAAQRSNIAVGMDECNVGTCGVALSFQVNDRLRVACSINGATVYFGESRLTELGAVAKRMAADLKAAIDHELSGFEFDPQNLRAANRQ